MTHLLVKENKFNGNDCHIDTKKLDGLKISPKNQVKEDEMSVKSLMLVNPSFIEKVLKKKIKHKLDYYINYIITLLNDDDTDDTTPAKLNIALDDVARYKSIIEYKYRKYLDDKYINLLLKKVNILEHELKVKTIYLLDNVKDFEEEKEKTGKSR